MTRDLNGGDNVMLLSEGRDISRAEADLLSAGLALKEFIDEHLGKELGDAESAWFAVLLLEWAHCASALDGIPESRLHFLREASRPRVGVSFPRFRGQFDYAASAAS